VEYVTGTENLKAEFKLWMIRQPGLDGSSFLILFLFFWGKGLGQGNSMFE